MIGYDFSELTNKRPEEELLLDSWLVVIRDYIEL